MLEEWRLMKRVASSRKESRGPEQNWSSSDKLAAGASSRGLGLRMVEDAMTAAVADLLVQWQLFTTLGVVAEGHSMGRQSSKRVPLSSVDAAASSMQIIDLLVDVVAVAGGRDCSKGPTAVVLHPALIMA